jgi:hypothetical protein
MRIDVFIQDVTIFSSRIALWVAVSNALKAGNTVFHGCFTTAEDPFMTEREIAKVTVQDLWIKTNLRFCHIQNRPLITGHKIIIACSLDADKKAPEHLSKKPNAKLRGTPGMKRFPCKSAGSVAVTTDQKLKLTTTRIYIRHHVAHRPYHDITIPDYLSDFIRDQVPFTVPSDLINVIRTRFPECKNISNKQIYDRWFSMSESQWRHDKDQIKSVQSLLASFPGDEIDLFEDVKPQPEITQICFGLKVLLNGVRGTVVEIAIDATFGTNSAGLELYGVMAEIDGAGFPLAYCLLTTASATNLGKRKDALTAWLKSLRDKYNLKPKFFHTDKDMAEIGAAQSTWGQVVSLCMWHLKEAILARLKKPKLSTTPYNPLLAVGEFLWIDPAFGPKGRSDLSDFEGGLLPQDIRRAVPQLAPTDPQVKPLTIKLPPLSQAQAPLTSPHTLNQNLTTSDSDLENDLLPQTKRVKLVLPDPPENPKDRFFPDDENLQEEFLNLVEQVGSAHELLPGYVDADRRAIREWGVRKIYNFCIKWELPHLWAYMWENWLRPGRWELWARSVHDLIPIVRTTMIMEAHWRKLKRDFLHHFSNPRVDFLVFVIINKMVPEYYRRLDFILNPPTRHAYVPSWRKNFKPYFKMLGEREIPDQDRVDDRYKPNPYLGICTCPAFASGRWLFCKHLQREYKEIHRTSHLWHEIERHRTVPFFTHPDLIPRKPASEYHVPSVLTEVWARISASAVTPPSDVDADSNLDSDVTDPGFELPEEEIRLMEPGETPGERLEKLIHKLEDFTNGLKHQVQFNDPKFLETVERKVTTWEKFADECLTREARDNDARRAGPTTWEKSTINAMRWRSRPQKDN